MTLPAEPAERHRAVAAGFTARVRGATDWDAPAPVEGWRARDVVGQYGPAVPVPDGADVQARLLGFIGRDPSAR